MKLSHAASFLLLVGVVSAAPSGLEARADPPLIPITLEHQLGHTVSFKCGSHEYTGADIYLAVQYSVALQGVDETRGAAKYPHSFNHDDSKGNKLVFPSYCPADKSRQEYPLRSNSYYNGGKSNRNTGDERVVYYYTGKRDVMGHPEAYYCGIMTHVGAPTGGFLQC